MIFALFLIALIVADSVAVPHPRPIHAPKTHMGVYGTVVTTEGNSVASADVRMRRSPSPNIVANAEYMTVGPPGAAIPDSASREGWIVEQHAFHRLRVTLGSSERLKWLLIDDIVTGREDSRRVNASYVFSSFDQSASDLQSALQRAPRVLGADTEGSPIAWISPTSFAWVTRSDTLVFEQRADSLFKVTLRARVR